MAQWLRICLPKLETQVRSLGRKDPEKEMATHSSILGNPMNRGAWRATIYGAAKELDMTEHKQE